ncbi:MAG: pirin-like C-terminal cupin domain-containing protein [Myxococcota bacterium]
MSDLVLASARLGPPPWPTLDPFLFCVHHDDAYPAGNDRMEPDASLAGRNLGNDFEGKDGWRMYHGRAIPGFPRHPHRGFETVTLARRGYIDHSDSLGATARFGHGDAQWMTAGKGVVHCEMFPLVRADAGNPTELFQLWLNLPARDKMVDPYFTMFWGDTIPRATFRDDAGKETEVVVVAGRLGDLTPPAPPPSSWASRPEASVAIWTLRLAPGAKFTLPVAPAGVGRVLYLFRGGGATIGGVPLSTPSVAQVVPDRGVTIEAGPTETEVLLLQGRPIGEPVAQHGPFVMNTRAEIQQAFADYQRTEFGGWPWPSDAPVHARAQGRFAIHADGRREDRG